jgi:starvation-inducible outer membrane lipoprotein
LKVSGQFDGGRIELKSMKPKSIMKRSLLILPTMAASLMLLITACADTPQTNKMRNLADNAVAANKIKVGGVYAYKGGDGSFGILKVLSNTDGMVDTVLYKNRFPTVPGLIDPKTLEVSVRHEILSEAGFQEWQAKLLIEQPVTATEQAE